MWLEKALDCGEQRRDRREADNDVWSDCVEQGCNVILVLNKQRRINYYTLRLLLFHIL
jgi:hypothetical protein